MDWKINKICKADIKNPVLIEGLPDIGNVGKVVVDFIIDHLGAKKIYEISSCNFPHCVFVNEDNLVELPVIEVFHKKLKNHSLLLLGGDFQPLDERSCYIFCEKILDLFQKHRGKEIITLGGVASEVISNKPGVYFAGTNKKVIRRYQSKIIQNIYGVAGPIMGVSGLLTGLAKRRKIDAVSILAETLPHPNYIGVKGAREILKILNKKLNLNLKVNMLEKEINEIEKEIIKSSKKIKNLKLLQKDKKSRKREMSYIG